MPRVLIVGTGRMARIRAEAARRWDPACELVFVARDPRRAEALAQAMQASYAAYPDLGTTGCDVVFVTSSTACHAGDLIESLGCARPILIEKPVALNVADARHLQVAVETAGVPVVVGFQRRFDPEFRAIHDAVRRGELGRLYVIRSASMDHRPAAEEFIAESGGIFRDLFVHDFDAASWIAGQPIVEVFATGSCRILDAYARHGDLDVATVIGTLADGAQVAMQATRHCPTGQDVRWEVYGSADVLAAGLTSRTPVRSVASPELTCQAPWTTFDERFADAFVAETQSFLHSATAGEPFLGCSLAEAIAASAVAEACEQSIAAGVPVPVPDQP